MNEEKNITKREELNGYTVGKSYMECFFKEYRDAWCNNEKFDDRKLFCNMYDSIMEALEEMKNINSPMIWVGFNDKRDDYIESMKRIVERFK